MTITNMSATEATATYLNQYRATGAPITERVNIALGNRAKVTEAITQLHGDREALVTDLYAAIIDGGNLDSAKLATAARRRSWAQDMGLLNSLNIYADNAIALALRADAAEMVDHLRELFAPVAAQLTAEHELLGDVDLDRDGPSILHRGEKQAAALVRARAAANTIRGLGAAWVAVARAGRWSLPDGSGPALAVIRWTPAAFLDVHRDRKNKRAGLPYDALKAGHELRMPSADELREFTLELDKEQERRAALAREEAHRRPKVRF